MSGARKPASAKTGTSPAARARTGADGRPTLRLLTEKGRLVTNRAGVIALGFAARLRLVRAYALWPTSDEPMIGVEVGRRRPAVWIGQHLERRSGSLRGPRRLLAKADPPTWQLLRARGLLLGPPPGWLLDTCGQALGRPLEDASIVLSSPTGSTLSKSICYVFEGGETTPAVIAIAMADPSQADRLRREVERIEAIRSSLAVRSDLADALPPPPLLAEGLPTANAEEYLAVYPPDPMDRPEPPDREGSLRWLAGFQTATSVPGAPWQGADSRRCTEIVESAWLKIREDKSNVMKSDVAARLRALEGLPVPWCAVHGDFWEGNLVHRGGRMRVYDWEWASLRGRPFLDPWSYEVGQLLGALEPGRDLVGAVADAAANVGSWLQRQGIDPRFGVATLAPSLAEIAIRVRRESGRAGPAEGPLGRMMTACEEFLL